MRERRKGEPKKDGPNRHKVAPVVVKAVAVGALDLSSRAKLDEFLKVQMPGILMAYDGMVAEFDDAAVRAREVGLINEEVASLRGKHASLKEKSVFVLGLGKIFEALKELRVAENEVAPITFVVNAMGAPRVVPATMPAGVE